MKDDLRKEINNMLEIIQRKLAMDGEYKAAQRFKDFQETWEKGGDKVNITNNKGLINIGNDDSVINSKFFGGK